MPRSSGTYTAPSNSFNPAVANTTISKTDWNAVLDDIETALSDSIAKDGQTTTTAAIPFASGVRTDTVAENTTNTGVTVDGVLIKDGAIIVNESGTDVDSRMEGDGDANLFYLDAGNDRIGIGTATPGSKLDVSGTLTATGLAVNGSATITSTAAGAAEGPTLTLHRNIEPADNNVIGGVAFDGEDSAGNQQTYARLRAVIADEGSTSEDGVLVARTVVAGTEADRLHIGAGVTVGATNDDKGAGTVNAGAYYQDGILTTQIAQVVNTQTGAVATGSTVMVNDDSIPQSNEGDEYMTLAITPTNASSTLLIDVVWNGTNSSAGTNTMVAGLFQDSTANAVAAVAKLFTANGNVDQITFRHKMTAGTTSATTFKVRVGGVGAGTTTFNGSAGARKLGGVMASSITITEILP